MIRHKLLYAFIFLIQSPSHSQTHHFEEGISIRNKTKSHYHKMVEWDDSAYREFAYWQENQHGSILDFMNWRALFPAEFDSSANTKYPAIVFLHGAGESGRKWTGRFQYDTSDVRYDNNGHQLLWGGKEHLDAVNEKKFPGIVIFAQCSYNGAWKDDNITKMSRIIEYMVSRYDVDPFRIYMHGLSSGGKGTWNVATQRPDLFTAILPMSGVGDDINESTDKLISIPVWQFQGGEDSNPSPDYSQEWINLLEAKGGRTKYTLYPDNGHNTWVEAYTEPEFFSWMLQYNKRDIYVMGDSSQDVSIDHPIDLAFSEGFSGYQWLLNGIVLIGTSGPYYTAKYPGTYSVRFKQVMNGEWEESETVVLKGNPLGPPPDLLASKSAETNFQLYPNPVHHYLNISLPGASSQRKVQFAIYDLGGRTILEHGYVTIDNGVSQLDFSRISPGLYLIKLNSKTYRIIKK